MIGLIILGAIALLVIVTAVSWYRVVPTSEAHLVVSAKKRMVCSSDTRFAKNGGKSSYFEIPTSIPFFGRVVRKMDVTVKKLTFEQETYEKDQARYEVTSSTKYRIIDVEKAAESFVSISELHDQLKEIIQSSVRAVTVKYDVIEARSNKQKMADEIKDVIQGDLENWGVGLVNFVLIDFQDIADSTIISDISKRREKEIQSTTRQLNADRDKQARMKEAEADEHAKKREIERDKVVGEQQQLRDKLIAEKQKEAKESLYKVKQVEIVKQAEIDKEAAVVKANQDRETEKIYKERKQLEGEGDRLRDEQIAIGKAAELREKLFAEAKGKDELQKALNKYTNDAIRALTAELALNVQRDVGIAGAEALKNADIKMFAGSDGGNGFDIGKMIAQTNVSNSATADAILNKFARPNDLGLSKLDLDSSKSQKPKK